MDIYIWKGCPKWNDFRGYIVVGPWSPCISEGSITSLAREWCS